ncbi:MAG: spore germination protein [Clostridiaceae bacterium]|nr:spore germination protein [Clostridiaceae bacterium]
MPTENSVNKKVILLKSLNDNVQQFKEMFHDDDTFMVRFFANRSQSKAKFCLLYMDGMVDGKVINNSIIQPLIEADLAEDCEKSADTIMNQVIFTHQAEKSQDSDQLVSAIIRGDSVLLMENSYDALIIASKGWKSRSTTEPEGEKVIRGPREGFVEPLLENLSMIRRRLATPDLKFRIMHLGVRTKTQLGICYIDGIVNKQILTELLERIDKVNIDGVLLSGELAELIQDAPYSPFETIGSTEKPDVAVANMLEGRIIVIVDGTPVVLIVPYLLEQFFQSDDDYALNFYFSTISRILRILSFMLTISAPALYVALLTYHQEMIPTPLLMSILAARQGIPFPTIAETLGLILAFEILREAGIRMPVSLATALSILGALVIGTAAVEARIVSASVIIVVALTGLTGLMTQKLKAPVVVIRLFLIVLAGFFGIYGILYGATMVIIHLCSIRSFGVPYLMSYTSLRPEDLLDTAIRTPIWFLKKRPRFISSSNKIRQANRRGN